MANIDNPTWAQTIPMITITEHVKNEWKRMAAAARKVGHISIALSYERAASVPTYTRIPLERFDRLQASYRTWLCFNEWPMAGMVTPGWFEGETN